MNLIDKLTATQRELNVTDAPFAAEIGVTRSMWVQVRNGQKRPGRRFLAGVMRRFPLLADDCVIHLRDDPAFLLPSNVTDSNIANVTERMPA